MSDLVFHLRLTENELDYVLNGMPEPEPGVDLERTLADLHRWAETVADLIDRAVAA